MTRNLNRVLAVLTLSAAMAMGAVHAQAQSSTGQSTGQEQNYSEGELKTYAMAALEVQEVNKTYVAKLAQAERMEEKAKLRDAAKSQMVKAIRDKGITVEKYNSITAKAERDPELFQKISKLIKQAK